MPDWPERRSGSDAGRDASNAMIARVYCFAVTFHRVGGLVSDSDPGDMTGSSPAGSVHGRMIVSFGDISEMRKAFKGA